MARLQQALAGAGLDLGPRELSELLWLALQLAGRRPDAEPAEDPVAPTAATPPRPQPQTPTGQEQRTAPSAPPRPTPAPRSPEPPSSRPPAASEPLPQSRTPRSVYAMDTPRKGSGAMAIRIPAVAGLHGQLDVARSLRALGRGVPSTRRFTLDETATAESIADNHVFDMVLRPLRDRWLDLVIAVDNGVSLRIWHDTTAELSALLAGFGIFRSVRMCSFDPEADCPTNAVDGLIVAPGRTVVLVVSDGVSSGWHTGTARRHLARWARTAHTAVLNPLPARLWNRTGLAAQRMTVRTLRPAPTNREISARDTLLPRKYAASLRIPVPVLELGMWELKPWADLLARDGGTARLQVIDAGPGARPSRLPPPPEQNTEERILAFRDVVSSDAYTLAGHLASVDPLTLPVMRVVQAAAVPGSSPACLAEVFLSGLMRVEPALDGIGGTPAYDVFGFEPEIRELLTTTIRTGNTRRTLDQVTQYIAPRLDRIADFPALLAERTGTLALPRRAEPFAELSLQDDRSGHESANGPELKRLVRVYSNSSDVPSTGYLVAEGMVLALVSPALGEEVTVELSDEEGAIARATAAIEWWHTTENHAGLLSIALLRLRRTAGLSRISSIRWSRLRAGAATRIAWCDSRGPHSTTATAFQAESGRPGAMDIFTGRRFAEDISGVFVFQDGALAGIAEEPFGRLEAEPLSPYMEDARFRSLVRRDENQTLPDHNLPRLDEFVDYVSSSAAYQWLDLSLSHGEQVCVLSGVQAEGSATALKYAHDHVGSYDVVWRIVAGTPDWPTGERPRIPSSLHQIEEDQNALLILDGAKDEDDLDALLDQLPETRCHIVVAERWDASWRQDTNRFEMVAGEDVITRAETCGKAVACLNTVLAWYSDEVQFDVLKPLQGWALFSAYNLRETAERLARAGLARWDNDVLTTTSEARSAMRAVTRLWPDREMLPDQTQPVSGREIAIAVLLEHHAQGANPRTEGTAASPQKLTLIAPHALALAACLPPGEDHEVRQLFFDVGMHLVRAGSGEGVALAERGCKNEAQRSDLVAEVLLHLDTALALSTDTPELGSKPGLPGLLEHISEIRNRASRTALSGHHEILLTAERILGTNHPLTQEIRDLFNERETGE
ncbi:SAV_2336 N-terminal domain-related protein [Streptomyces sp. NPDC001492]